MVDDPLHRTDPVLAAEQAHLDLARRCLDAMTARAERIADYGVDELTSYALGRVRARRLASLRADPDAPAFFGRIDVLAPAPTPGGTASEVFHIGRRHVRDDAGDPVVIDWRAPIARPFYRATAADPQGVGLRRRFGFHHATPAGGHPDGPPAVGGAVLTSFEDEHLDRGEALGLDSALLLEEIERPRVGPMRDIVATIQPDQDDLVRADLDTSLCVQGAPGTGKTAVGLHRAAYLLYTYPERLRSHGAPAPGGGTTGGGGILVVGPNRAFLHYIAQVLPSLGEIGIAQATVETLLATGATAAEPADLAVLKGDARLADVLRRAVLSHIAKPTEDVVAVVGTKRYRVGAHHLRRYVDDARRALGAGGLPADGGAAGGTGLRWNDARARIRLQVAEDVRRQREDAGGAPSDAETARVARSAAVRDFLDATWPEISAPALLARLYDDPVFLRRCGPGLSEDERAALARPAPRTPRVARWTAADAVLLDELAGLITGGATYGHVVVDEAQDLSAMQCRAIARRCPLGSMTVLGDLAQATTAWAPGDWGLTLTHLGRQAEVRALTTGYRVPRQVLELANRLLPHIAAGVPAATSVRSGRDALRFGPRADLAAVVATELDVPGSIGVLVPDALVAQTLTELAGFGAEPLDDESDPRVTVVPAGAAKGLEFDAVVVLDPERIVRDEPSRAGGLRRLYVVLTRAVSRLVVLHDGPLPPELG